MTNLSINNNVTFSSRKAAFSTFSFVLRVSVDFSKLSYNRCSREPFQESLLQGFYVVFVHFADFAEISFSSS